MALLADLHGAPWEKILSRLEAHPPELILLPGDLVYGMQPKGGVSLLESQKNVLPFLSACAALAPAFLSLGNHEWCLDEADLDAMAATGVTVLDNRWVRTEDGLLIGGLTSGYVTDYRRYLAGLMPEIRAAARYPQRSGARRTLRPAAHLPDASWLRDFCAQPGYHILLSHHPENISLIPKETELVVSAHAHGGQWRYYSPLHREWRGVFAPGQGLFPKLTSGVHGNMVITRGLCNTARVPRFFNPREIVYIV